MTSLPQLLRSPFSVAPPGSPEVLEGEAAFCAHTGLLRPRREAHLREQSAATESLAAI